ncbi:MAG: hypothetical protein U9N08_08430 [Candidatus Caldatribacteriota bacterium]|nr:hypothetical protein [Candidatus Caldatribacteriota bacterium]
MTKIEEILQSKIKPKEKQLKLVQAVVTENISVNELIHFFESAKGTDKGTCADVMKHVSKEKPEMLESYIELLINYVNADLPRVKWGMSEAIGNLAGKYPEKVTNAIPYLLKNATDEKINTTVIKWCAAYGLTEIAKNNPKTREQLLPEFEKIINREKNNGVKNVYLKALKKINQ